MAPPARPLWVQVFNFKPGFHSVWQIPRAECFALSDTAAVELSKAGQGTVRFTLAAPGDLHFACSIDG